MVTHCVLSVYKRSICGKKANTKVMITRLEGPLRVFKNKYVICTTDKFPEIDLDALKDDPRQYTQGREIIAYNFEKKLWVSTNSGTKFCQEAGLTRARTMAQFKLDVIKPKDGWIFLYYSKENKQRLDDYIKTHYDNLPEKP